MYSVGLKKNIPGVFDFDIPKPSLSRPDEVMVRLHACGICGTDKSLYINNLVDAPSQEEYLVLGHEGYGIVEEVGSEVRVFKPGDWVVPTVRQGCGICAACRNHQSDYCYTGLYKERGIHKMHGFLTEYVVEHKWHLVSLPQAFAPIGVWVEPMSIIIKAIEQMLLIQKRVPFSCPHANHGWETEGWGGCKKGIVIGAGPLGFLATAVLAYYGMEIYNVEIVPEDNLKVQLIKELGARYIDGKAFTPQQVAKGIDRIDLIFEASGASKLAIDFIPVMSRNAIYLMTGVPRVSGQNEEFDADLLLRQIVRQNQVIIGSVNGNRTHFQKAVEMMEKIEKRYDNILSRAITHRFPLKEYQKAFDLKDQNQLKVVLEVSPSSL